MLGMWCGKRGMSILRILWVDKVREALGLPLQPLRQECGIGTGGGSW